MKRQNQQEGFTAIIAFVLAAAVIGVAVFAASRVMNKEDTSLSTDYGGLTEQAEAKITNSKELTNTQKSLETIDVDKDLDTTELDKDIDSIF